MRTQIDLHGRAALITGAGRRLGKAFARAVAEAGGDVCLHYGTTSADELAAELAREHGVRAVALQADLADASAVSRLFDQTVGRLGEVDLLVNSASVFGSATLADTDVDSWRHHLAVNLTAPFLLSQAFARHRNGRSGAVVNLLDWRALRPGPDHLAYTISKAGLAALTQALAQSLAPGIRVNGLALGAILPPPDASGEDNRPAAAAPLGRWGTIEETCQALLFLLGGPDFITGEILHLDGGRHLT